jgi:glycosyltransferase 2 family protein
MPDQGFWGSRRVRIAMRLVALALVALLAWRLRELWQENPPDLSDANIGLLVVAAFSSLAAVVAYGSVWPVILRHIGARVPHDAVRLFFQSQLGKYVPGSVWQYAGRVGLAKARGVPARLTMISVGVEVAASAIAAALVGVLVLPLAIALPLLLVLAVVAAAVWLSRARPPRRLVRGVSRAVRRVVPLAPADLAVALRATPGVTIVYVPVWAAYGVALWLTARSFTPIPATDVLYCSGTFALGWLAGMAAVFAPSGIGVREAVLVALLGPRIGHTDALVVAAMSRILLTAADLAGAGAGLALARVGREHLGATVERPR